MGKKEAVKLTLMAGHGEGQSYVGYVPAGQDTHIVTCGADGKTVLRDGETLEELYSCKTDKGPAHVVAVSAKHIAVGDEEHVKVRNSSPPRSNLLDS